MQHECTPQMFQNKYVILVSAAAQVESVRVLTYGFVGGPESGDRPDMKHTPFMLRLLTENLLSQEGTTLTANETAGQKITMKYSVSPTPAEAASSEIARDTRRMAYAIATGDFEHILEIDPEIAVAGDEDDKGFLWNVETSSYRRVLRVGSPSERTEWIDAVTTAALAQQSRSPVLDEDAISEALAAAVTYRDTSSQLREEMRKFRQASEATWEQWVATSTWAQDASRHAHPSPSLESAIHLHLHWLHLRVHLKRSYFRFFCSLPRRERFIKSDAATSALFLFCFGFACSSSLCFSLALALALSSMARKSTTSSKGFTPLAPKKNVSFSQSVIGSPTFKTRVSWARCELNTRNDGRKG
eukprot:COSAG03_NODE_2017_length_3211_cov_1.522172_2_plen_358_part_00